MFNDYHTDSNVYIQQEEYQEYYDNTSYANSLYSNIEYDENYESKSEFANALAEGIKSCARTISFGESQDIRSLLGSSENNKNKNSKDEIIDSIINLYISESQPKDKVLELISLPISEENLLILKTQWNKQLDMSLKTKPSPKNIWKRLNNSFKNQKNQKQHSSKRSLYDILTK